MAHTTAIERRERNGKSYFVMVDAQAFRDGTGVLLAEVQRIKAEGDYAAAKALVETYGVHFEASLRDEVVARVDALKLPSYSAFVMPRLSPVRDEAGRVQDIEVTYPCDLEAQMLEYSALARHS
jgi:dipeptidyl-peptidase-3